MLDNLPSPLVDPHANGSRLARSYIDPVNDASGAITGLDLIDLSTSRIPVSTLPDGSDLNDAQHTAQPPSAQEIDRCFLDTVVQFQAGETSTLCSIALSMIFRHNRKGLSIAELQQRLKNGIRIRSGVSKECRIENSILLNVLADISA